VRSGSSDTGRSRRHRARGAASAFVLLSYLVSGSASRAEEAAPAQPAVLGETSILSAGPLQYRPGRGLRVGSTGAVIGGFTNVKAEHAEESGGEFSLDTLNFFLIFDRFTRFRAVAELQLKDIFTADDEHAGTQDFAFDVRRLFGEVTVSDELHLRAGTFLTPVGYWNLILAPPLTWTTEPPLIVEETFFQQTTTGVMLHGSTAVADGRLGYSLFTQFLEPLENDPDLNPPDHTAGLRLAYDTGLSWSVGATYQAAEDHGEWSHLGGVHARWQHRGVEVLSEVYFQDGAALRSSQWGTYLQGVLEVHGPFYLVGRYEHFDPPTPERTLNLFTLGGVYKPLPFMALKVEYRFVDHSPEDNPAGFFSSFTTSSEMRRAFPTVFAAACLVALSASSSHLSAADVPIRVIVHPRRAGRMTESEVRAIYLKRKMFWDDGQPIIPINREAGSSVRERFSEAVFGQGSHRLAAYWNQRYFEAGEFPPATLASDEAVIRFVAGNEDAIGYVGRKDVPDSVAVVLVVR
jgi:hypothetical protein